MSNRRRFVPLLVPLLFGVLSFSRSMSNPRIAALRSVDIVQLMASGICFGAAIALLVVFLRGKDL